MIITVHVEWPTGNKDVEFEMDEGSTLEQIEEAAREAFLDVCNYGLSIDGEPQ